MFSLSRFILNRALTFAVFIGFHVQDYFLEVGIQGTGANSQQSSLDNSKACHLERVTRKRLGKIEGICIGTEFRGMYPDESDDCDVLYLLKFGIIH